MPYIEYKPEIIDSKLGEKKNNYPILIEPYTTLRSNSIEFKIDVIFQPKEVLAKISSSRYYIGLRNATVVLIADDGICKEATKDIFIDVEYTDDLSQTSEVKGRESSEFQIAQNPVLMKTAQELNTSTAQGRKATGKFKKSEKQLSTKLMRNRVQWYYSLPESKSLFSDLLDEVLQLEATLQWNSAPLKGTIQLKPGEIEIFSAEKKRFPNFKNLAMIQVLFHKNILLHKGDIDIKYQVI